jgi:hypothetical protein
LKVGDFMKKIIQVLCMALIIATLAACSSLGSYEEIGTGPASYVGNTLTGSSLGAGCF